MYFFRSGTSRITAIVDRYRKDVQELDKGIVEVEEEIVDKEIQIAELQEDTRSLAAAKTLATNVKAGLLQLLNQ